MSDERGENEEDARGDGVTWHVATQRTGCGHVSTKWQPGSWSADPWLCKNIFVDILVDMFVDISVDIRYTCLAATAACRSHLRCSSRHVYLTLA